MIDVQRAFRLADSDTRDAIITNVSVNYITVADARERLGNSVIGLLGATDDDYNPMLVDICELFAETEKEKAVIQAARSWLRSRYKSADIAETAYINFYYASEELQEEGTKAAELLSNLINFDAADLWLIIKDMGKEQDISKILDERLNR